MRGKDKSERDRIQKSKIIKQNAGRHRSAPGSSAARDNFLPALKF
jgi:hypothetical protein